MKRTVFTCCIVTIALFLVYGCGDDAGQQKICDQYAKHCSQDAGDQCQKDKNKAAQNDCKRKYRQLAQCEVGICRGTKKESDCASKSNTYENCLSS